MKARRTNHRSGLTIVELVAAMAIAALIMANVLMVSRTGADATKSGVLKASIEDELDLTLDRITLALRGSSKDEIHGPGMAPLSSQHIEYSKLLGEEDGKEVMSDEESIAWSAENQENGHVVWTVDSEEGGERGVTWSRAVPVEYMDEVGHNGGDDNGNGLIDEKGLAFTREEDLVKIHLTVQKVDENGRLVQQQQKYTVTCRN